MSPRTHPLIAFVLSPLVVALPLSAEEPVETLRAQIDELRADLDRPVEAFNLRYKKQLTALKEKAQAAGNLDLTVAATEELSTYLTGGSKPATLPELKRLQEIYADHSARLKQQRAGNDIELLKGYIKRLDAAMTERTQASDIEAALAYRNEYLAVEAEIRAVAAGKRPTIRPSGNTPGSLASATKDRPFENTLGMKFVTVPITGGPTDGKKVLFSIWETRRSDYKAFVGEMKRDWRSVDWKTDGFEETEEHPAVMVNWGDAKAFCAWLTEKERKAGGIGSGDVYRLPSDHEWSCAVGIGEGEDPDASPGAKALGVKGYPWGSEWPPPKGAGNFSGSASSPKIDGYEDGHAFTAPVGSYEANGLGIHDLGGNAWEWCEDTIAKGRNAPVFRGGSWNKSRPSDLRSSSRYSGDPHYRDNAISFRCVLEVAGARTP